MRLPLGTAISAVVLCLGLPVVSAAANESGRQVAWEQRIGEMAPWDLELADEMECTTTLQRVADGLPVLMVLGYNECPMLCDQQLNALGQGLAALELKPGEDYRVIFVSVDPYEPPGLAEEKRQGYLRRFEGGESGWRFVGGSESAVTAVADAVGFGFRYDRALQQFAHPSGVVGISKDGLITGYITGIRFPPDKLENLVLAATKGETTVEEPNLLVRCLLYNPLNGPLGSIVRATLKASALLMIGLLAGYIGWNLIKERRNRAKR